MKRLLHICIVSMLGGYSGIAYAAENVDVATSLEAVRSVSDRVGMIERRLSDLILTLHATRFPWVAQEIEQLVGQVRAVMLGACGEYGEQYRARCCEALYCAQRVLPRLMVKIEGTLVALKTKWRLQTNEEDRGAAKERRAILHKLHVLYDILKEECKALEHAVQRCSH